MLIVIAVIAILVSVVLAVAGRIDLQAKRRLTESTMTILNNALEQFRDYQYDYKHVDYTDLDFPPDANDYSTADLEALFTGLLGITDTTITGAHDPGFSGSEAMYFFLSQVPECRTTLERIDKSLITSKGRDGQPITVTITHPSGEVRSYPLLRLIDPWQTSDPRRKIDRFGKTIRYDYYDEDWLSWPGTPQEELNHRTWSKRTFPHVTSAGPDGRFNNIDDIVNIKTK